MIPDQYKLAAVGLAIIGAAFSAGAAGWTANGWRHDVEIAKLKAAHEKERADMAGAALTTLKADAAAIHQAATEYAAINTTLAPKIAALTKELRNAPKLPVDCRPDAFRVRNLDSAIDAANQAIPR